MQHLDYSLSAQERALFDADYADHATLQDDAIAERVAAIGERCSDLRAALMRFRDPRSDLPLLVIRGIPRKSTQGVPTPSDRRNPPAVDLRTEHFMMMCVALIGLKIRAAAGEPFPFDTAFHHVIPQQEQVETPAVNTGAGDFPFHQDRVFLSETPLLHLLAGVRLGNDPCPTSFMDSLALLRGLPPEHRATLRRPEFMDPKTGARVPILRDHGSREYVAVDLQPGWMLPTTAAAGHALEFLRERSAKVGPEDVSSILIGPGELVIHDHHRLMHGRERFKPDFSRPHHIRWLVRAHAIAPLH